MTDADLFDRARLRRLFDLESDVYAERGGGYRGDPLAIWNARREKASVHAETPHGVLGETGPFIFQGLPFPNREHFTAYDYDSCTTVMKNDDVYQTRVETLEDEPPFMDAAILFMNGLEHRNYRTLVQPSFVPAKAHWWLDNWVARTVSRLADGLRGETRADLNVDFCAAIPLLTITGSFGIDDAEALDVREIVTSNGDMNARLAELLLPIIADRRRNPGDDLITVLVEAELTDDDGELHTLSDFDVLAFSLLLLAAGSGTTWKQMGLVLHALLTHPEAMAAAHADRGFLRNVIEEVLRWQPTDPVFSRFAIVDTELGGTEIPAGSVVHACFASANRDPARWPDHPDDFDPFRQMKHHLGFGYGPHTCLGMHVARAEMTHGVSALLDRFPEMRLDPDAPEPSVVGIYERGFTSVPVLLGASS